MTSAVRSGMWTLLVACLLASPAVAFTVSVLPTSPGLDQGFGYSGCPSCTTVYSLTASASVGAGSSIQFTNNLAAIEVVDLTLVSVSPSFVAGPNTVNFSSLTYTASVNASVVPFFGLFLVQQTGAATGTVTGSYSASLGGSGPINASADVHSLICVVDGAGQGTCGVTFGPTGFAVNDGAQSIDFQHTFNLVIPEPGPLVLMVTGVIGLAFAGRRRT